MAHLNHLYHHFHLYPSLNLKVLLKSLNEFQFLGELRNGRLRNFCWRNTFFYFIKEKDKFFPLQIFQTWWIFEKECHIISIIFRQKYLQNTFYVIYQRLQLTHLHCALKRWYFYAINVLHVAYIFKSVLEKRIPNLDYMFFWLTTTTTFGSNI